MSTKKIVVEKTVFVTVPKNAKIIRCDDYLTLALKDKGIVMVFSKETEDVSPNEDLSDTTNREWVEYTKEEVEAMYKMFHPRK